MSGEKETLGIIFPSIRVMFVCKMNKLFFWESFLLEGEVRGGRMSHRGEVTSGKYENSFSAGLQGKIWTLTWQNFLEEWLPELSSLLSLIRFLWLQFVLN